MTKQRKNSELLVAKFKEAKMSTSTKVIESDAVSNPASKKQAKELRKKLSINRLLIIVSCTFVVAALIVFAVIPRSAFGPTLLLVGVVSGFGYAARTVNG